MPSRTSTRVPRYSSWAKKQRQRERLRRRRDAKGVEIIEGAAAEEEEEAKMPATFLPPSPSSTICSLLCDILSRRSQGTVRHLAARASGGVPRQRSARAEARFSGRKKSECFFTVARRFHFARTEPPRREKRRRADSLSLPVFLHVGLYLNVGPVRQPRLPQVAPDLQGVGGGAWGAVMVMKCWKQRR